MTSRTRRASSRRGWGVGYRYVGPVEEVSGGGAAVAEVEKTRGVRIVVEEEIQEAAAGGEVTATDLAPSTALNLPASRPRAKTAALAFALLAVIAGAVVILSYRPRPAATEAAPAPIRSVAVLPMKNLTGDPEDEYFSDGITESLINSLSKIEGLKVISRGSSFAFKGKDADPREAGRLLGAAAVLEGSVLRSGERVRVNVRLAGTPDGQVLWSGDAYDRSAGDILAVQDEIARSVASGLRLRLGGEDGRRLAARYTNNVEAYEDYLKGRYSLNKRTPEGITKAIDYFRQATAKDPTYALAYAALAECCDKAFWFMSLRPREAMAGEKEAAARALALDESLAEAHVAMATVYANEWNLPDAAKEEERAIEINPSDAEAHHNYAYRLIDLLRPEEAVDEINRARELDPLNEVMNVDVGQILTFARRYDEAVAALRDAVELEPRSANARWNLAAAYELKGMHDQAVAEFAKALTLNGDGREAAALKKAYAAGGMKGFWRERLGQLTSNPGHAEPSDIANIYTELCDKDRAFTWLERAYQERSPALVGLESSPWLDALRSDARYEEFVRRIGLP